MPNVRTKEPPRLQAGEYVRYVVCFEREGNSWGLMSRIFLVVSL